MEPARKSRLEEIGIDVDSVLDALWEMRDPDALFEKILRRRQL